MSQIRDARLLLGVLRDSKTLDTHGSMNVSALASRSLSLWRLGEIDAARHDLTVALQLEPEHPEVLRAASVCYGRDYLEKLLVSPFVGKRTRAKATEDLPELDAPVVVSCLQDHSLRVTLVWKEPGEVNIAGTVRSDHFEILGRTRHQQHQLIAADLILDRTMEGPRCITINIGSCDHQILVPQRMQLTGPARFATSEDPAILWVLVPVFNGAEALGLCLRSLARELAKTKGARALILDDGSTDPETLWLLRKAQKTAGFHVQRTDTNRGFVKTVNSGLDQITTGPVLLLNSDTYLPPGTLARLLAHIADPEVATVTPLSNNAGSFSIPKANTAFAAPGKNQADALARRAARLFKGQAVDVLNGNGFCMLISDAARRAVGMLSEAYVQGYYEEVDFCLRAAQKGFRHVAALDCFVPHIGGVSFQDRKTELVSRNQKELYRRFPFYPGAYRRYQIIDPLAPYARAIVDGSGWTPVEDRIALPTPPKLDVSRLKRPLVIFDLPEQFVHFTDHLPDFRLCPSAWVDKYMARDKARFATLRQIKNRLEIIGHTGAVLHRTCYPAVDSKPADPPTQAAKAQGPGLS